MHRLEAKLDELWSFVRKKTNRLWVWIARDATTRQIIAFQVGDPRGQSVQALWQTIPSVYQTYALFYTDQDGVYTGIIPPARHRVITKLARTTTHVERFNCTSRHRVSRLVPASLSFLKNLAHYIEAIKYFIYPYNLTRCAALPG